MGIVDLRSFTRYNNDKAIWRRMKNNNIVPICWMMKKVSPNVLFFSSHNKRGYTITEIKVSAWLLMNAFLNETQNSKYGIFCNIFFWHWIHVAKHKKVLYVKKLKTSILYFDLYYQEWDFCWKIFSAYRS